MKTLKSILIFFAGFILLIGCSESDLLTDNELDNINTSGSNEEPNTVTVPFKADFLGEYAYVGPDKDEKCGSELPLRVKVSFVGSSTQLGKFTGAFDFCAAPVKAGRYYDDVECYMVAANGDILFLTIKDGQVIGGRLDNHPDHVTSYWRDRFVILGGTGRFEGASGGGLTDDYNSKLDKNSHHHWRGTITLVKGKR